jgi:transcriptional regulator with XRE-family HTH domain
MNAIFGSVVREWRTERGFSQEAFAHHCGIHRTYQTHIERGTKMPTIDVIQRLAMGLNVEISELFLEVERRGASIRNRSDFIPDED